MRSLPEALFETKNIVRKVGKRKPLGSTLLDGKKMSKLTLSLTGRTSKGLTLHYSEPQRIHSCLPIHFLSL